MFWTFKLSFVIDFFAFLDLQLFGLLLRSLAIFFNYFGHPADRHVGINVPKRLIDRIKTSNWHFCVLDLIEKVTNLVHLNQWNFVCMLSLPGWFYPTSWIIWLLYFSRCTLNVFFNLIETFWLAAEIKSLFWLVW